LLRTGKIFPIGFHLGPGGNANGLKENFLLPLDRAGIRYFIVSADAYPYDAAVISSGSVVDHTVVYRVTTHGQDDGVDYDVPDYSKDPVTAADIHFDQCMRILPPEYHFNATTYAFLNEIDKNRSDWLGWFSKRWVERAMEIGLMTAGLGFSSGEPEYDHWLTPGMRAYLTLVSQHRDRHSVAIHEYSYTVDDIWRWYPNLIGRYQKLMQACDEIGIPRVSFLIKEWGWEYQTVPSVSKGIQDMDAVAQEYVKLQENYGAGTWYLGPSFGGIADKLQPYIYPLGQLALDWQHYIDWQGDEPDPDPEPPPQGDNMLKNASFELGTYKWAGIDEINIPNEWDFSYAPESEPNPIDSNPWSVFRQPEVVNPGKADLPPQEHDLFILDGDRTLKVFKGSGSIKFRVFQKVSLQPGKYKLRMPVFADLVKGYESNGAKIWADDPQMRDGLYRPLFDGVVSEPWLSLTPGGWNTITVVKTVKTFHEITIGVEIMLPFALENNGVFMDDFSLEITEDTTPPPAGGCIDTTGSTRYHLLRPMEMDDAQWAFVRNKMTGGIQLPEVGHVILGYEGWSHLDAMGAIIRALNAGFTDSRLIVMDGEQIGSGLDQQWMNDNCPFLAQHTIFISSTGAPSGPFEFKVWPSAQAPYVTQLWGANPANYLPFGLPGHDGVDIRASEGVRISAVAPGHVYRIEVNENNSNYGLHVRVRHQDGWKTIYGHASRINPNLRLGQYVEAGDWLMDSGNTGNSFGAHLHLGLKHEGYTYTDKDAYGNDRVWPYELHDPTVYLKKFCPSCFPDAPPDPEPPPAGLARLGLHASADAGLAAGEAGMFAEAKVDMVKVMSIHSPQDVAALANARPGVPFVIRVFQTGWDRPGGISPNQFIDWNTQDVQRYMPILQGRDIYIELHNEPNLRDEGWQYQWANGAQFSNWLLPVIADFRKTFPTARIVFPGLSPGGDVGGIRYDNIRFVQEAAQAVNACDVLGVHAYWQKDHWPMSLALGQVDAYRRLFPDKPIAVTEASNNRATVTQQRKGEEYIWFWRELQRRKEVLGVTYFVASASNATWGWDGGTGETWHQTSIPGIVGSR
jgi:murein DD-endopeptidase MepM/ murein hydrolase activator NlpD